MRCATDQQLIYIQVLRGAPRGIYSRSLKRQCHWLRHRAFGHGGGFTCTHFSGTPFSGCRSREDCFPARRSCGWGFGESGAPRSFCILTRHVGCCHTRNFAQRRSPRARGSSREGGEYFSSPSMPHLTEQLTRYEEYSRIGQNLCQCPEQSIGDHKRATLKA